MLLALGLFQQTRRQKRFGGSQVPSSLALCSRLQLFEFLLRLGLRLNFRLGLRFRRGFGFRFVLLFQKLVDALLKRHQIIRDAPRHLLPIRGEFNADDQVWRGLKPDANFSRERFVERILYSRALLRRHVKRAPHNRRVGGCLKGRAEAFFRLAVHLSQAASEHLTQAFFQTRRGEIRQRLSSDRKHFLLGPAAVLRAAPRPSFALPSISRKRRVNTSPRRSLAACERWTAR